MPANHNFHVNCPRKWHYSGDVSIEYGGLFLHAGDIQESLQGKDDRVRCIEVMARNFSNQWSVYAGLIWTGNHGARLLSKEQLADAWSISLDELQARSAGQTWMRVYQVEDCFRTHGMEMDHVLHLQVGKTYDGQEADRIAEPDHILQHNARIENWLRNNILRTW